jgi:predicted aspartyl protease
MRAEFPLKWKSTQLGAIADPVILIPVLTKYGYQNFDFLVDTGADCSIMPCSVTEDLDIELSSLPRMRFSGIEGRSVLAYITKITVKITNTPIEITCALSTNEKSPFILGRKDIFSHFNISFNNKNKLIRFIRF